MYAWRALREEMEHHTERIGIGFRSQFAPVLSLRVLYGLWTATAASLSGAESTLLRNPKRESDMAAVEQAPSGFSGAFAYLQMTNHYIVI